MKMAFTNSVDESKPSRSTNDSAFYSSLRKSDVFLCSYPKSGITWLGFMMAHVLKHDPGEQFDLNTFCKYVPSICDTYVKRGSLAQYADFLDPRFFRCQATFDAKLPRVIYMLRDPRDAMLSYWHYKRFLSSEFKVSLADFLAGDHLPCEWNEHVAGWLLPQRHPNFFLVRYETLHENTAGVLKEVLKFAGINCSDSKIDGAVEASRFERMRAAEERGGVAGRVGEQYERFVRRGRVASWQEEMGYRELRIIEQKYADVMRKMGYDTRS
jgi:Sulfotransferase domain